jgi:hypothetical protein
MASDLAQKPAEARLLCRTLMQVDSAPAHNDDDDLLFTFVSILVALHNHRCCMSLAQLAFPDEHRQHRLTLSVWLLLLQDRENSFDFGATYNFEASRPARVIIPKVSYEEEAPSPTLLAAIADRERFESDATTISNWDVDHAKACGAAQRSATLAVINANAAAHEAFLQSMSKAQRTAYFNISVRATAEEVAAGTVEDDVDFDLAYEQAMAELPAIKQKKVNVPASPMRLTIKMWPSDDLAASQQENSNTNQEKATPAASATATTIASTMRLSDDLYKEEDQMMSISSVPAAR